MLLQARVITTPLVIRNGVLFTILPVSDLVPESHSRILFPRATYLTIIVWVSPLIPP